MSVKTKIPNYRCTQCGWNSVKWAGRCLECRAWGTVDELPAGFSGLTIPAGPESPVLPIRQVQAAQAHANPTGIEEFDRVLGGGLVPGAVLLLAGEPGIGKSTLLLTAAARYAEKTGPQAKVLYVAGEESMAQVKLRAERIGALTDDLLLTSETNLHSVVSHVESIKPELLIIDSVQTLSPDQPLKSAGSASQLREVTAALVRLAKAKSMATILVGHVTKDGSVAGPRLLEHLVDVLCQFDGQRHSSLRLIRTVKNRFGPTNEVGCFSLTEDGITDVSDPSQLFVSRTKHPVSGTCLTVTLEGKRPLAAEIQALLMRSASTHPKRGTYGLDGNRINMLLAVLQRRTKHNFADDDAYVATVGGVKLSEPAVDLATVLAFASAQYDKALPERFVALGEVGLAGEIRPVPNIGRRLKEAERLGFTHAVIPASPEPLSALPEKFKIKEVSHILEALRLLFPEQLGLSVE